MPPDSEVKSSSQMTIVSWCSSSAITLNSDRPCARSVELVMVTPSCSHQYKPMSSVVRLLLLEKRFSVSSAFVSPENGLKIASCKHSNKPACTIKFLPTSSKDKNVTRRRR
ncbi:hypothetical protein BaRGS_00009920 [Batillaria attramentaria]|uniref:Uncharacterized protein n=1 Tax=Batillaria attramentaria TaxID=370345 RepID=A0ABD0LI98_9CAEN